MPTLILRPRPTQDPLKRYKWALLGLALIGLGGGGALTLMSNRGSGTPADDRTLSANDQSLDALETAAMSDTQAPGIPLTVEGAGGAYAKKTEDLSNPQSMLYQPVSGTSAPGAPLSAQEATALNAAKNSNTLAQALTAVAGVGKTPRGSGWGGEAPRTGLSRPQAKFAPFGQMSSNVGGTSAVAVTPSTSLGSGRANGGSGLGVGVGSASGNGNPDIKQGHNQTLNFLKQAEALATQAMTGTKSDAVAGLAGKSFDATASKATLTTNAGGGLAGAGISDNAVPDNLKADAALSQKTIKPPPPVPVDPNLKTPQELAQEEQQQMEQVLIQASIGGIAGPLFGSVGTALAGGLFGASAMNNSGGGYGSGYTGTINQSGKLVNVVNGRAQ